MKPLYVSKLVTVKDRGASWSVYEVDARINLDQSLLHNLAEWQAKAIAAILNSK
jgi:hypothetical protein